MREGDFDRQNGRQKRLKRSKPRTSRAVAGVLNFTTGSRATVSRSMELWADTRLAEPLFKMQANGISRLWVRCPGSVHPCPMAGSWHHALQTGRELLRS